MFDKNELSQYLKISINTIDRHMAAGMPYKKIGKLVRFDVDEVMSWFANQQTKEEA